MQALRRRRLLVLAAAVTTGGCASKASGSGEGSAGAPASKPACDAVASGPGLGYCLVEKRELRVPGAASLAANHALLVNVDDGSAAIVARDEKGLYALSAICTHACCIVSLCSNRECTSLETNPGNCAVTPTSVLVGGGEAAFLCPCHGSAFTADGTPISGPAKTPLPSLALRVEGTDLVVDLSRAMPASARV